MLTRAPHIDSNDKSEILLATPSLIIAVRKQNILHSRDDDDDDDDLGWTKIIIHSVRVLSCV